MYYISELLKDTEIYGNCAVSNDARVTDIVSDSKKVTPGCMFVCLKGLRSDGHDYVSEAFRRGAYVVVCDEGYVQKKASGLIIRVKDPRSEYAKIMSRACGEPSKRLKLIAITGTNGKTTVATMISSVLTGLGKRTVMMGTLGAYFEGEKTSLGTMTTPDPSVLYPLLERYADKGAEYVVMEASSHALALGKLDGLKFKISAVTNVTPEHLDFHGNMEEYAGAKAHLFELSERGVFCIDDEYTFCMAEKARCDVRTCSVRNTYADYVTEDEGLNGIYGVEFDLKTKYGKTHIKSKIPGVFTVSNAMLAASVLIELGFGSEDISRGIAMINGVRGRMERLFLDTEYSVFIDFAHTPDALTKLLETVRVFKKPEQRIVTLFGCGGDRDPSKRSLMGAVASRLSDFVIITSDNSRSEETSSIISDIMSGFDSVCPHIVIESRKKAIEYVIKNAEKGDIILLCGKGHEEYEIDKSGIRPFSERDIVYSAVGMDKR